MNGKRIVWQHDIYRPTHQGFGPHQHKEKTAMTTFTKSDFNKARDAAHNAFVDQGTEAAMCIATQKVMALDASLIAGKYVDALRQIANRYERMLQIKRDRT